MQTLTFGFQLPETGDKGSVFFPGLESNIAQMNDHDHNGTNSKQLSATALVATSIDLANTNWVLVANGIYRQLVTLPVAFDFQTKLIKYLINSGTRSGQTFHPQEERVSANTYYIYSNDNSIDVKVSYL